MSTGSSLIRIMTVDDHPQMPNVNGNEAIIRSRSQFPDAKILMLSTYGGDVHVLPAIKAGDPSDRRNRKAT